MADYIIDARKKQAALMRYNPPMKLVAVLRQPHGLTALVSRRKPETDLNTLFAADEDSKLAAGVFEIVELPLDDVPALLCPQKLVLLTAWEALCAVQTPSTGVLNQVLTILQETAMCEASALDLPPLILPTPPAPVLPTAAHPRAFQGTTHRPPKPKSAAAVDLRPYLCAANSLTALLNWLADVQPPSVSVAQEKARWEQDLPALFRTTLLSRVRARSRTESNALLSLHYRLELQTSPALLAAVARLLCLCEDARPWLDLMTTLPPARRPLFADLLLETEVYAVAAADLSEGWRSLFALTAQGLRPASRLYGLFQALKHGISPDYMAAGFRLDDAAEAPFKFHEMEWAEIVRGADYPEDAIAVAEPHWARARDYHHALPWHVWRECGRMTGLGRLLEAIDWMQYPPEVSYQYSRFYRCFADYDTSPHASAAAWKTVEPNRTRFNALLHSTPPEYQGKLLANLIDFRWNWAEDAATLGRCLPSVETLLHRLCRPPFRKDCDIESVAADFLEFLEPVLRERFLQAPDASFQRLEDASRRTNDAWLCGLGTWSLTRHLPEWALEAFLGRPAKLFKVCKLLGAFSHALRDQVVREFIPHRVQAPMPRLLRAHQDGTRRLPDDQLVHYQEQWRRQTLLKQLEALEEKALARLSDGFSVDPAAEAVRHALQLQFRARENRPALRRFLKAHWTGDSDYLLTHPRTRAWLKRHPWLNVPLWRGGIPYAAETAGFGPVTISVEQDPLEALKLGTYVGSCLGLGGSFVYSAAAVVLDINKQVLYARKPDGTVLARQLVAVSEEGQLVCFTVYPYTIAAELQRHFSDYDRQFAQALGVTVHRDHSDEDYTIHTVIAHDWWDDCVWAGKDAMAGSAQAGGRRLSS